MAKTRRITPTLFDAEEGFIEKPLGEVAELLMGNSPPGDTYNENGNGLPLINGPAEYGPQHPIPVKWTTAANRICKPGDVLVCVRGNTTGRMNIADQAYCIGRGVAAIRGRESICETGFLEFVLVRLAAEILGTAAGGGSTFPNINKPQLAALQVPLPPLAEQRAIAHVLRAVQRAKEAAEAVVASARQLKRSLLRHLFTYGPVPVAEADRVPLKETEIGPIPEHWELKPLRDVADLCSGGTPSKSRPDFWEGLIPWASPKDLKRPRLHDTIDHVSEAGVTDGSRLVQPGSIFIVVRGMILANDIPLAMAMVPMAFNQDMKAIVARKVVAPDYLLYAMVANKAILNREIGSAAHGTKRITAHAVLLSVIASGKRHGLNPWVYLKHTLNELTASPARADLADPLPSRTGAHARSVRSLSPDEAALPSSAVRPAAVPSAAQEPDARCAPNYEIWKITTSPLAFTNRRSGSCR